MPKPEDVSIKPSTKAASCARTVLRPTWHFVLPQDIRWLQSLTGPRVRAANAYYYRKLGLDAATFRRSRTAITKALRGGAYRSREEIAKAYAQAGIAATGMRLAYLVMHAELEGLVCSGPLRGKRFTRTTPRPSAPTS